jgi:hypothetical protein
LPLPSILFESGEPLETYRFLVFDPIYAFMNRYLFSLLFFGVFTLIRAESPQSNVKGVLILTSASGNTPISIPFTDISFSDFDGGVVMDASGAKQAFSDHDIGKVLYLDENYYSSLHQDSNFLKYATGLQSREILVSLNFPRISTPEDLSAIRSAKDTLDDIQAHYPQAKEPLQPEVDVLNSDLSRYEQHQVFVNGKWTAADEATAAQAPPGGGNSKTTFTAKNGKVYSNVTVFVTDVGVSVLTEEGGTTIPFDQLPDDITVFPKSVADQILACRKRSEASQASAGTAPSSAATSTNTPANSPAASTAPVDGFSSSDRKTMQGLRALLLSKIQEQVQDLQKALEPPHQPSQGYPERQNHYGQSSQQNDPLQQEDVLNTFRSNNNNHDSLSGPSQQSSPSQNSAQAEQQNQDNIRTKIENFSLAEIRLNSLPPAQVGVEIVNYADSIDAQARMGQSLGQFVSNVGTDMINAPPQYLQNTRTGEITETDDSGAGVLGLAFGAMMQINAQAKKDEVDKIRAALESLTPSAKKAIAAALRAQPKQSN